MGNVDVVSGKGVFFDGVAGVKVEGDGIENVSVYL